MQRLVYMKSRVAALTIKDYVQPKASKPRGVWWSCGNEWYEWCKGDMPDWCQYYSHCYELRLNDDKILHLETPEQILEFTAEYGGNNEYYFTNEKQWMPVVTPGDYARDINWPEVAKLYSGIEICPYQYSLRLTSRTGWYYGWDIASGCVWDHNVIEGLTYLGLSEDQPREHE